MSVVIRMKRTGRRNRPCYRISVADSRSPRDGRTLESLGLYDPVCKDDEKQTTLNVDRARHWLSNGAQPSETVRSIFKRMGVFEEMDTEQKKRDRFRIRGSRSQQRWLELAQHRSPEHLEGAGLHAQHV